MKRLLQIGIIMVLTISITACGSQAQAETPAPTTAIETTASTVEETTEEPTTEESTEDGEVIASMGRYGEYGKEAYDLVLSMWLGYELETEEDLREAASSLLGSISKENYEAIIAEILAMDRGQNQNANAVTQSQPAPAPAQSTPQSETKASAPTQSAPAETQASVQPTQPAPEEELAPGALTIEEIERRKKEAGMAAHPDVEIADPNGAGMGEGTFNWQ